MGNANHVGAPGAARQPWLEVEQVPTADLVPYANNSKIHTDAQVDHIAASIERFGMCDPVGAWHNPETGELEIVTGHGRVLAMQRLGREECPVIMLDHLSDEERRAYSHVNNTTNAETGIDWSLLAVDVEELGAVDWSELGLPVASGDDLREAFEDRERFDDSGEGGDEGYAEFVEKFVPKKTTDDCYTPDEVYEAVAGWTAAEYGVDRADMVRPFYPGGDYERFDYPAGCCVVDNPPFSLLTPIIRFYCEHGIRFLLFAPTLTLFSGRGLEVCYLCANADITYENGAQVNTSFVTNMQPGTRLRVVPDLNRAVMDADERARDERRPPAQLRYTYPSHVVTAAMLAAWADYGVEFSVRSDECERITALDSQREKGKAVFGGGFLLSDAKAVEVDEKRAEAEAKRAEAEAKRAEVEAKRAEAEAKRAGVDQAYIDERGRIIWPLSERERAIVARLSGREVV